MTSKRFNLRALYAAVEAMKAGEVTPEQAHDFAFMVLDCDKLFWDGEVTEVSGRKILEPNALLAIVRKIETEEDKEEYRAEMLYKLVMDAHNDPLAFDAAKELAVEALSKWSEVPPELKIFSAWVLSGKLKRPRQRGISKLKNQHRDFVIRIAVSLLVELGFSPTKNVATEGGKESASEIVSSELKRLRVHIQPNAVIKIWRSGKGQIP